ncbi:MAG: hypothetical protein ACI89X_001059 [Planctomycetota bacterium]|jgi:hypothetical protein
MRVTLLREIKFRLRVPLNLRTNQLNVIDV